MRIFPVLLSCLFTASSAVPFDLQPRQGTEGDSALIRGILEGIDDSLDHSLPIPVITPCIWTGTCEHPIKRGFTSQACSALRDQYPDYAVFVYHNQDSTSCKIGDYIATHYELNLFLGFTYGYEVLLFKQGWFELAGDGGDLNFCTDSDPAITPVILDGEQYVVDGAETVCVPA